MAKERITKTRADYSKLEKYFIKGEDNFHLSREQMTKITEGYISDNPDYLKRKDAPLAKKAAEYGYHIEKVEKIVIYFKKN